MSDRTPMTPYGPRVDDALALAAASFRDIVRKETTIPYLTHLLQVATWVGEHGGTEDQFIAALLHDYLEDIEGSSKAMLAQRFGPHVAELVEALSDTVVRPKPPWRPRKEQYLARLAVKSPEVKLISAADKLHNARSIVRDHGNVGEAVWARFSAPKADTLWYYRGVLDALGTNWSHALLDELAETVREMHRRAGSIAEIDGTPP